VGKIEVPSEKPVSLRLYSRQIPPGILGTNLGLGGGTLYMGLYIPGDFRQHTDWYCVDHTFLFACIIGCSFCWN